jgi:exopolysaccharide biosynthesis polyprenyl glycosylphosphotransferase
MQKRSELFFNLILLPIDFLAVFGSFLLAYIIRLRPDILGFAMTAKPAAYPLGIVFFLKVSALIIPVWILIFALTGLYSQTSLRGKLEELGKIFVAVSGGVMFMIVIDFASREPIFPAKAIPIWGYGLSLVMVTIGRWIVRGFQRYLFSYGVGVHRVVIIGSGPIAQRIAEDLLDTHKSGFKLVGVLDRARSAAKRMKALPLYRTKSELLSGIGANGVDEFIQADSSLDPDEILDLVNYAYSHHLIYRFVPTQFGLYATNSSVQVLSGLPVVQIRQTPLEGWGRIIKRSFDIVGAGMGLIIAAPLLILISLAIRLTDPGPVLYHQRRLSRGGLPISIYKFRTMKLAFCTGENYGGRTIEEAFTAAGRPDLIEEFRKENKLANDPRISRIGRFLRRTSLDELPQLINVLKGDLSLVGPRPMLEDELDRYGNQLSAVLSLRCGLTGLWQVSGRTDIGFEGRIKMDLYYVENWSLGLDIRILLKTAFQLFRGKGAY